VHNDTFIYPFPYLFFRGLNPHWIGMEINGGDKMELERIINARLLYVCEDYIDYECDRFTGQARVKTTQRRFARIDKKDFPKFMESEQEHDGFELLMDSLKTAIKDDAKLSLVIEKRDVEMEHANPNDKSLKKKQRVDFIIKVEWTWAGEGE